ncbi:MAG: SDR family NAD(P)-dependent oxidoreductase [Nitrososphaeria archaeon]
MTRVLVTGGAGFIGGHLVERLLGLGYDVIVVDNLSAGEKLNLSKVLQSVNFVQGDVRDKGVLKRVTKDVDYVAHLAALVSVSESMKFPNLYFDVNVNGTLALLNESSKAGVGKFVFVSSCAVYGNPISLPVSEGHPLNPISPYAESKLAAERHCRMYSQRKALKTTILRLFNVYGPRQGRNQYAGVITQFIRRVGQNQPPIIYGSGDQTRDFIYVGDVVEYIVRALVSEAEETYNIGSGKQTSINELAGLVTKIMGRPVVPLHLPPREGDIVHSCADISKAKKILSYAPQTTLEEGLRKTIHAES